YDYKIVSHLLQADYQREEYNVIDSVGNVNASTLNNIKRNVLEDFWGDSIEINDGAELTWMRQPHYYMWLYPYTYSAGLTISTVMSQRIFNECEPALNEWTEVITELGKKPLVDLSPLAA